MDGRIISPPYEGGVAVVRGGFSFMKKNIVIIGYGRFGGLYAKILAPFGKIFVLSNHKVKDKNINLIDYPDLAKMDWIIVAVPISALEETLKKIKPFLKKGSLVMDVCSVKAYPCKLLKKHIPEDVEIIGTHPMFGPDSAKNGLENLQMVICPLRQSNKTLKELISVFKKLKLKIIRTTAEDHDKQGALNLSLVHYIGRALAESDFKKINITTAGYIRLAEIYENVNNDTWQLFLDMQKYNPYAKKVRKDFLKALEELEKKIN